MDLINTQISMLENSGWSDEDISLFRLFGFKCGRCKRVKAVTIHEIIPKSKLPKSWNIPENRIPLCNSCHREIHDNGCKNFVSELLKCRLNPTLTKK